MGVGVGVKGRLLQERGTNPGVSEAPGEGDASGVGDASEEGDASGVSEAPGEGDASGRPANMPTGKIL